MKYPINDIELIERYFDNNLTDEETDYLKARLEKDAEFKKIFNQEKLLINTIRFQAAQSDLRYLKQLEESLNQRKGSNNRNRLYYYAAAACMGLIALAAVFVTSKNNTPDALYTAYFKPYPNIFEPTLRGNSDQSSRRQAFQAYEEGNYQQAAHLFSNLLHENNDAGMVMLLGNSNLMLEKTQDAKENFMDLMANYDTYDIEAKWYLALCYLKTGEKENAENLFRDIASSENLYTIRARELLEKLKK